MSRNRPGSDSANFIMKVMSMTSIFGSAFTITMLCISTAKGGWVLGHVTCQLYALFSYSMVTSCLWLMALAAFERPNKHLETLVGLEPLDCRTGVLPPVQQRLNQMLLYRVVSPAEHPATFSHINTRILVVGLVFIATVLCSAPLYGWGEYSNYKGVLEVFISIVENVDSNAIEGNIMENKSNTPAFSETSLNSETDAQMTLFHVHDLCKPVGYSQAETVFEVLVNYFKEYFEKNFDIYVRKSSFHCLEGKSLVTLRANNEEAVKEIVRLYQQDLLASAVEQFMAENVQQKIVPARGVGIMTSLDMTAVSVLQEVFIPFQGIGVCTFDFTTVYMMSSIVYILVTTTLIPYFIIFASGISLFVRHYLRRSEDVIVDYLYVRILYVCGFSSIVFCVPYYVTNFINANGRIISIGANFFSTMLFYVTPLCVSIPYIIWRISEIRLKERIKSLTNKTCLLDSRGSRYPSSMSVKADTVDAQV